MLLRVANADPPVSCITCRLFIAVQLPFIVMLAWPCHHGESKIKESDGDETQGDFTANRHKEMCGMFSELP